MPSPITFGVEFEFMVATLNCQEPDPHANDPRLVASNNIDINTLDFTGCDDQRQNLYDTIKNRLEAAGLPARVFNPHFSDSESDSDGGEKSKESSSSSDEGLLSKWLVYQDGTISPPQDSYHYVTVEINSPAYIYCPGSIQAVKLAVDTLVSNFRVHVNTSCGLHVHVGQGTEGLNLALTQDIAAFLWVFEPVLSQLHPEHRSRSLWCQTLRGGSGLAMDTVGDVSLMESLQTIYSTTRKDDRAAQRLQCIIACVMHVSDGGAGAYNFNNLLEPYASKTKRTLEFRQHAGTMDAEQAIIWIHTAVGIVSTIRKWGSAVVREFVHEHTVREIEHHPVSPVKLLELLGLQTQADYYERDLERRRLVALVANQVRLANEGRQQVERSSS